MGVLSEAIHALYEPLIFINASRCQKEKDHHHQRQ
jgi:hypothetical protein